MKREVLRRIMVATRPLLHNKCYIPVVFRVYSICKYSDILVSNSEEKAYMNDAPVS